MITGLRFIVLVDYSFFVVFFIVIFIVEKKAGFFFHPDFPAIDGSGRLFLCKHLFHIFLVFAEFHGVADGDGDGKFLHIVVGSDVDKCPSLLR